MGEWNEMELVRQNCCLLVRSAGLFLFLVGSVDEPFKEARRVLADARGCSAAMIRNCGTKSMLKQKKSIEDTLDGNSVMKRMKMKKKERRI